MCSSTNVCVLLSSVSNHLIVSAFVLISQAILHSPVRLKCFLSSRIIICKWCKMNETKLYESWLHYEQKRAKMSFVRDFFSSRCSFVNLTFYVCYILAISSRCLRFVFFSPSHCCCCCCWICFYFEFVSNRCLQVLIKKRQSNQTFYLAIYTQSFFPFRVRPRVDFNVFRKSRNVVVILFSVLKKTIVFFLFSLLLLVLRALVHFLFHTFYLCLRCAKFSKHFCTYLPTEDPIALKTIKF